MINIDDNNRFNSSGFIPFVYKWRKLLLIVLLVSVLGSWFFSSSIFITPKYRSSVILFPVATNSVSKVLISQNSGIKEDVLGFGEEEQAEQMLQILNSNLIRDRVIEKFNLFEHYDINPDSKYKITKLINEYESNVKFSRTEYMAVKISVLDKDAVLAADIANTIAELLDSTKNQMQRKRAKRGLEIVEEEYFEMKSNIQTIVDSLRVIGKMGVNDYESQSEVLNEQLAIAISKNDKATIRALDRKLNILAEHGSTFLSLKNSLEFMTEQMTLLKAKYEEAKVDAEQDLPQKFIISSAYPAEKKSYPVRWAIVVVSVFSALLLSMILILIAENVANIRVKKN